MGSPHGVGKTSKTSQKKLAVDTQKVNNHSKEAYLGITFYFWGTPRGYNLICGYAGGYNFDMGVRELRTPAIGQIRLGGLDSLKLDSRPRTRSRLSVA